MKRKIVTALLLISIVLMSFMVSGASCARVLSESELGEWILYVFGYYSYPVIYITDGTSNFSNPLSPVTGTSVTDATVTVSNETTGVSTSAAYTAATPYGYYTPAANFAHTAGQSVSLTIQTSTETITGSPTITPDPSYSGLGPATGASASLPFTITWTVTQGAYDASHTWVSISDSSLGNDATKYYQEVVPISQTSLSITSADIPAGNYNILVFGVNTMTLTGAKTGSVVYVDGGGQAAYSNSVIVQ